MPRHLHLATLLLLTAPALAQSTITTTSTLVLVPALVRVPSGEPLPMLSARDFILTDNGIPQKVTIEDTERQPLSIVILLQTGGAAQEQLPSYAKLGTMLPYMAGSSPAQFAMVTFDSQPEDQWDFTPDIAELEDGFKSPGTGDHGAAILDAVSHGIDLLRTQPTSSRRILIVVSQVHDEGSHIKAEEIVRRLGESNITIECLTFSPEKAWLKDQFTKPRSENPPYQLSPDLPPLLHTFNLDQPLREALHAFRTNTGQAIATLSGGEALPFTTRADLEQQLVLLANHLAASFTLSFHPTSKQAGFHALQLHVIGQPDTQVSARTSYWTPAP